MALTMAGGWFGGCVGSAPSKVTPDAAAPAGSGGIDASVESRGTGPGGEDGSAATGGAGGGVGSGGSGGVRDDGGVGGSSDMDGSGDAVSMNGTDAGMTGADASSTDADAVSPADSSPPVCDASPDATTLTNGLVSWWKGEGNASDSAGSNNGVLQNGVTFVPGPTGGQAFQFNGTTADVLIPNSTTLDLTNGFTIAFWINVPAWPAQRTYIVNKAAQGGGQGTFENKYVDMNPDGTMDFFVGNVLGDFGGTPLPSATPIKVNTWHHFAATYNGSVANIYIDGLFDASKPAGGVIYNAMGSLAFAHNSAVTGTVLFFAGALDDIRWYSRGLSAAEVAELASTCN